MAASSSKNIIITGAAGFLGSHFVEKYLNRGQTVVGVDNFCTGMKENLTYLKNLKTPGKLIFIEADVSEPWNDWMGLIDPEIRKNVSHILHLASPASPPHYQRLGIETIKVNTIATAHAIKVANELGARMVFSSTSEIYGDPAISPQHEAYWGNVNPYGERSCYDESKRLGETIIYTENKKRNTKHGLVRIFNTYGPRMNPNDGRVVINLLIQAVSGKTLTAYGDGKHTRSFCYVDDLCDGIDKYLHTDLTIPINIGNPNEFTILELIEEIKKIPNVKNVKVEFSPLPKDDPKQRRPDLTLARKHLNGWEPKIQLHEGLLKTLDWLKSDVLK